LWILGGVGGKGLTTFVVLFRWLIYDGAVFEAAKVEHSYTTICATTDKNIDALGAEADVEDFFIVGDELGFRR
jgi:hypothetical protein